MTFEDVKDFIFTYGWAILILLAAVGLLAAFGVLYPNYQPTYTAVDTSFGVLNCTRFWVQSCGVSLTGCKDHNNESYACLTNVHWIG
jgi:hypothetical protein